MTISRAVTRRMTATGALEVSWRGTVAGQYAAIGVEGPGREACRANPDDRASTMAFV